MDSGSDRGRADLLSGRYSGSDSRSFYVGKYVAQEDIHARFENGILSLTVPKVEESKYISIEG